MPHEGFLAAGYVGEYSSKTFSFGLPVTCGAVVEAGEVGREDRSSIGTEDAIGEETGDSVKEIVFADANRGG